MYVIFFLNIQGNL